MINFKKQNFTAKRILKAIGVGITAIILIAIVLSFAGLIFNSIKSGLTGKTTYQGLGNSTTFAPLMAPMAEKALDSSYGMGLSARNMTETAKIIPQQNYSQGNDAEDFEIVEYNASIETRGLETTCNKLADLKIKDYIIFENANKYERGCNYRFKVKKDNVSEVLNIIKNLSPKELSENIHTIKKTIDDFTSETEILTKKKESIDETLNNAIKAYDDISAIATKTEDAESLTKIIDSKVRIIERLTQERININAELERLARAKTEQLDRLEYTFFNVSVIENKFIDTKNIADSWKSSIKKFITNINNTAQGITINLAGFILLILQYIIYLFIILIFAKYGWKLVKYIWKK